MKTKFFLIYSLCSLLFVACNDNEPNSLKDLSGNGTLNGHDYVDLGLPSGTLWDTCNVGASSSEKYGDYFAWGETESKLYYDQSTYKFYNEGDELTKYCNDSDEEENGFVDYKTELDASDDVATAKWGKNWRMPSILELEELMDECSWTEETINGVRGYQISSSNGNHIFLPAANSRYEDSVGNSGNCGFYWSKTLLKESPKAAHILSFVFG